MNKHILGFSIAAGLLMGMPASAIEANFTIKWVAQASKKSNTEFNAFSPVSAPSYRWDPTINSFISPNSSLIIQTAGQAAHRISSQLISHELNHSSEASASPLEVSASIKTDHTPAHRLHAADIAPSSTAKNSYIDLIISPSQSVSQPLLSREKDLEDIKKGVYKGEVELLFTAYWATNN